MSLYIPDISLGNDYPIKLTVWPNGGFNAVVDDVLLSCGKAIEVQPHGRLVDADAFINDCPELMAYEMLMPTIIPTDGEEP